MKASAPSVLSTLLPAPILPAFTRTPPDRLPLPRKFFSVLLPPQSRVIARTYEVATPYPYQWRMPMAHVSCFGLNGRDRKRDLQCPRVQKTIASSRMQLDIASEKATAFYPGLCGQREWNGWDKLATWKDTKRCAEDGSTGLLPFRTLPLHFLVGKDAIGGARKKIAALNIDIDAYETWSEGLDE